MAQQEGHRIETLNRIILIELMWSTAVALLLLARVTTRGFDATTVLLGGVVLSWGLVSTASTLRRPAGRALLDDAEAADPA